jgi:sortase A
MWLSTRAADELISAYEKQVQQTSAVNLADELERARAYNAALTGEEVRDPFVAGSGIAYPNNYESVLNLDANGVMGYLEIPALDLAVPIYHGTSDAVLDKGVGHIPESALPVGGEGTRCVLAAHRGRMGRELFTNVDKLKKGDIFLLHVLGETYAYKIVKIEIVEPEQLVDIRPEEGRDLCTLMTCTPLNINSHRLLLHGERTEYTPDLLAGVPASHGLSAYEKQLIAAGLIGAAVIGGVVWIRRRRKRS